MVWNSLLSRLEIKFVYSALTWSGTALGPVLRIRDYHLAPSALMAAVSKQLEASLTKTRFGMQFYHQCHAFKVVTFGGSGGICIL